ncbi:hypothetical protein BKA69DRAFT_64325 [Paraphysoderma sedebokerense]|nr:hypothetical protein BKA69DRAFT_64325 [Paraphysoderma sedebokerense]
MPPRAKHRSHIDTTPAVVPQGAPAVDTVPPTYPVVRNGHSPSAVSPRDPVFPRNDVAGYPNGYPPEPQSHIYPATGAHYPANAPYHPSDRRYFPNENGSHRAVNGVNGNGLNGNHFVSFHLDHFATAVLDGTLGTEYPLTPSDSVSPTDQRYPHLFHHSAPSHVKRHAHIALPHQFYSGIGAHHHRPDSFVPRPNGHLTRENGYTSSSGSSVASNESRNARVETDQMNYLPPGSTGAAVIPPPDRNHRVERGDYISIDHSRINHHRHGMPYSHSSSTRHHHHRHAHMTHHLHVHSAATADKRDGYVEVPPLSDDPSGL